jgi:hypothetical protein
MCCSQVVTSALCTYLMLRAQQFTIAGATSGSLIWLAQVALTPSMHVIHDIIHDLLRSLSWHPCSDLRMSSVQKLQMWQS